MAVYNTGASILRATGDSKTPFMILIAGCLANVALDLLFVVALGAGVRGAALATVLCQVFCALATLIVLQRADDSYRLKWKELSVTLYVLSKMLRIGIPGGIQSSLYTTSNIIIQSFINSFGTNTVASWAAYAKLDAIFWMLIGSLGVALTTFTGQNFGASKFKRIKNGTYMGLAIALALITDGVNPVSVANMNNIITIIIFVLFFEIFNILSKKDTPVMINPNMNS